MTRRVTALLMATAVVAIGGMGYIAIGSTSSQAAAQSTPPATGTAQIARRTLVATTQVDGTLGYADGYTIANALATSAGGSGGGSADAQQAYASAKSQYGQAVAELDAIRRPASADLLQLRAQLARASADVAEATATLRNDQAAAMDTETRRRVTVDEAQLRAAEAAESAARAALSARLYPATAQIRQAQDAVTAARAALDAASSRLGQPRGVLTRIAAVGSTVQPGQTLFTLDGDHPVVLMTGGVPAWRDLAPGVADGTDIEQLETNLQALAFASVGMTVDRHWDARTTAAVKAWQKTQGAPPTGVVALGAVVFEPAALRITADGASLGATVQQGATILHATSTTPVVTVALDPALQTKVHAGDAVSVIMPDGTSGTGAVAEVGTVATAPQGNQPGANASPTIDVTIALDDPSATGGLDQAPVSVSITTSTASDVLAVPVSALVELLEGGYAVQIRADDGSLHYTRVQLGLFANGWVEVTGQSLSEGQTVVVAQ